MKGDRNYETTVFGVIWMGFHIHPLIKLDFSKFQTGDLFLITGPTGMQENNYF